MTATLSSGFVAEAADRQEKRRRAISGAVFSEFIDMFDFSPKYRNNFVINDLRK